MGQDINIDFGLLGKAPDVVGNYANAFQVGQTLAKSAATQRAANAFATDPAAGAQMMSAIDPVQGAQWQGINQANQDRQSSVAQAQAEAGGDWQGAKTAAAQRGATGDVMDINQHVADLSNQEREAASQRAEQLAAILHGLQATTSDPNERLRMAQHIAASAPSMGIDPRSITLDDVTDTGIAGHMASVMTLQEQLEASKAQVVHKGDSLLFHDPLAPGGGALGSDGGAASAPAGAPAGGMGPVQPIPGQVGAAINAAASKAGASPAETAYLHRLAMVESSGNPNARNGSSTGLFQFHPSTFAASGGGDINDVGDQTTAALNLARQNGKTLQGALGRPATPGELYLAHQQSAKVAQALLTAPQGQSAISTLEGLGIPPRIAQLSITGNRGTANMSAQDFANMWKAKFGDAGGASNGGGGTAGGQAAPNLPRGYRLVSLGGGDDAGSASGHVSTAAELKAAGLPTDAQAWTDPKGAIKPMPQEFASQAGDVGTKSNLTGPQFLASLPPERAAMIKALDQGRLPLPSSFAISKPYWQGLLQDAAKYDPNFDAANYPTRAATRRDFTSGVSAKNVTALNTALGHMATLDASIDALHNSPVKALNAFSQWSGSQVGNSGTVSSLARFNAARNAVADELTRVFRGTGGSETDVQGWLKQLDAAKSPVALHATVGQMASLLASRVNALGDQYNQGMGRTIDGIALLHPEAANTLARLTGANGREAAAKAAYYQQWERNGGAPSGVDAAWEKFRAGHYGQGAQGAQRGQSSFAGRAPPPNQAPRSPAQRVGAPTGLEHLNQVQLEAMALGR